MFLLPTRTAKKYRGEYPQHVHGVSSGNSAGQKALCEFLGIRYAVHLETRDGRRFIACISELHEERGSYVGLDIQDIRKDPRELVNEMSQERYDEMLAIVRAARDA